ncbi:hypothetical protein [Bradyrhizobium cenepequi]|uniref:hypothetical protein n=1 Tax=Bradyrhizobium cenepequi TaxID=2821403 RepID=UPI001CE38773|nr:hypothetical protein [Bradyrhizobium cenepequi]MCA6109479.1 hypothetical protein [Bradyrhizobium cenepequi]
MPVEESSALFTDSVQTREEAFENWTTKRRIGKRKVSRSIPGRGVRELEAAWRFAKSIGQPMNRFVTIRPSDIDDHTPVERIEIWQHWRNRLAQFARDNRFPFTSVWTRESEPDTGRKEHLHLLMHVPRKRLAQFDELMTAWAGGTEQILNEPADYGTKVTDTGRYKNVFNYMTKNSPQAAYKRKRYFRSGGPILGKRFGTTSNIASKARAVAEVRGGLRRDLGLETVRPGTTYPSHKRGFSIFDAIVSERPVVTRELASEKIAANSNNSSKSEAA